MTSESVRFGTSQASERPELAAGMVSPKPSAPSKDDQGRFEALMHGKDEGQNDDGHHPETPDPALGAANMGEQVLAGLGLGSRPEPVSAPAAAAPSLQHVVEQVAERVLVGERSDGTAEIRVTLRAEAGPLGGAEVRIAMLHGTLELAVTLVDEAGAGALRDGGTDLVRMLADRLDRPVVLTVAASDDRQDRRGRSEGLDALLRYAAERP